MGFKSKLALTKQQRKEIMKEEDIIKEAKLHKIGIVDCVKQIMAINKELADIESRDEGHMMFIVQLRDRIERLERQLQATSLTQLDGKLQAKQKGKNEYSKKERDMRRAASQDVQEHCARNNRRPKDR